MPKQIKLNKISDYANLKLFDLEILNQIKEHIKEMCSLRNEGLVIGIDVDTTLKRIKSDYKDLLNKANKLP